MVRDNKASVSLPVVKWNTQLVVAGRFSWVPAA